MGRLRVLYDADCGFCRWSAARLRAWDRSGRLAFEPIQSADALLRSIPAERRLDAMHVVDSHGRVWTGGAALTRVASELPGGQPLAALGRRAPNLTETLYGAVARRRVTFGRWLGVQRCATDPGEGR